MAFKIEHFHTRTTYQITTANGHKEIGTGSCIVTNRDIAYGKYSANKIDLNTLIKLLSRMIQYINGSKIAFSMMFLLVGQIGNTKIKVDNHFDNPIYHLKNLKLASIASCSMDTLPLIFEAPTGTERMRIDVDGQVGIGTQFPNEQLEITGNLRLPYTTTTTGIIKSDASTLIHTFGEINFFAGIDAGNLTMNGSRNTAVGNMAFAANTYGNNNTAVGVEALNANSDGNNNSAIGSGALGFNTSGTSNTAIGLESLLMNISGSQNTAIGVLSLSNNIAGDNNTAVGVGTMANNSEGFNNTAVGVGTMANNSVGFNNTAFGQQSLTANTEGPYNTAIGWNSMNSNTVGFNNTTIGANSNVTYGDLSYATAIGAQSVVSASNSLVLGATTSVIVNVGIGDSSPDGLLEVEKRGTNDILLLSSDDTRDGDLLIVKNNGQVGIGTESPEKMLDVRGEMVVKDNNRVATFESTGSNSFITLQNNNGATGTSMGYFDDNTNEYFFIDTPTAGFGELIIRDNGNTGIGTQNPQFRLHVAGTAGKPGGGPWTAISDIRLKKDVIPFVDGLSKVLQINPVKYRYNSKSGMSSDKVHIGVIAQDMETVLPYTIDEIRKDEDTEEYLAFDPNALTYILINAIKEQQKLIEHQQVQIDQLIQMMDKKEELQETTQDK